MSRAGDVESVPPSTLCCLLISDARLVQYPSFPMVEALSSPVFSRTIPESSAPRLKQKVRLGFIAKELALFELFLRTTLATAGTGKYFGYFWCVYKWRKLYLELQQLLKELVWFKILFSNTDIAVK